MGRFVDEVITGLRQGKFESILRKKCQEWRKNPTQYVIDYAVTHFIDDFDAQNLFDILTDPYFHQLKKEYSGLNSLRADLQKGIDFFSTKRPNIIRYIQLLFLKVNPNIDNHGKNNLHQEYCQEFSDFLQLDIPFKQRKNIGIHRVLNHAFPIKINLDEDEHIASIKIIDSEMYKKFSGKFRNPITIDLLNYQLGNWQCKCGALKGQEHRYKYSCKCGSINGNGILDSNIEPCYDCQCISKYITCTSCSTRVNLDIIWKIKEAKLEPADLQIPLILTLLIRKLVDEEEIINIQLMKFPLLVGIREKNNSIYFEIPDIFWANSTVDKFGENDGQILAFKDRIKYDRQTKLRKILEAMMLRSFRQRGTGRSLKAMFARICIKGQSAQILTTALTKGFIKRLNRITSLQNDVDLLQNIDISLECCIASSNSLTDKVALINRSLLNRTGFQTSCIINKTFTITKSDQEYILTPTPQGRKILSALDEDGIIRTHSLVSPNDVLVGLESSLPSENLSPEDKLLKAIFGEKYRRDSSFLYKGSKPARVVNISIQISDKWKGIIPQEGLNKSVQYGQSKNLGLNPNDLFRISITLISEQSLQVGDFIFGNDSSEALVCSILGGATLAKLTGSLTEPDIVVAPDHPWAPPKNLDSHDLNISMNASSWLIKEVSNHTYNPYDLITERPLGLQNNPPQEFQIENLEWLLSFGAINTAYELYGTHSDYSTLRLQMRQSILKGYFQLTDIIGFNEQSRYENLINVPSGNLKSLAFFLRGLGIKATFQFSNQLSLNFQFITDDEKILESKGEVTKPETINHRTLKPEMDGLFCERIFGPSKDWECWCGKYHGVRHRGIVCERCGVEVTESRVRRHRMGCIKLAAPVTHVWYLKSNPSYLSIILDMPLRDVEQIVYFNAYVVLDPGKAQNLSYKQLLTEDQWIEIEEQLYSEDSELIGVKVGIGAEAIQRLLEEIKLEIEAERLRKKINKAKGEKRVKLIERLQIIDNLIAIGFRPELMVVTVISVIPPDLRPMIQLNDGKFATSDLNYLYRRVIERNNRLARLQEISAPEIILRNEKRFLQESVDALIDNNFLTRPVVGAYNRPLVGLANHFSRYLSEKTSLLEYLLSQPLDYSCQTRLVAELTENLDTALFPESMAWDLFEMPIIANLIRAGVVNNVKAGKKHISNHTNEAYQALKEVISKFCILVLPHSSSWQIIALKLQLTSNLLQLPSNLALTIHPDLMNILGWENLGKPVTIFAIFSEEAQQEAKDILLPSVLSKQNLYSKKLAKIQDERKSSIFYLKEQNFIPELIKRVFSDSSEPLGLHDYFVLRYWLSKKKFLEEFSFCLSNYKQ